MARKKRDPSTYRRDIDPELVVDLYRTLASMDGASCAAVADALAALGVTTRTGRPPSRQAVHYILSRHPDGLELLEYTKKRIGRGVKA